VLLPLLPSLPHDHRLAHQNLGRDISLQVADPSRLGELEGLCEQNQGQAANHCRRERIQKARCRAVSPDIDVIFALSYDRDRLASERRYSEAICFSTPTYTWKGISEEKAKAKSALSTFRQTISSRPVPSSISAHNE
jgi:hypothetical protein